MDNHGPQPVLSFESFGHNRISPEGKQEHFENWLVMKKEEFLARRTQFKELQKPYAAYEWWIKPPEQEETAGKAE